MVGGGDQLVGGGLVGNLNDQTAVWADGLVGHRGMVGWFVGGP